MENLQIYQFPLWWYTTGLSLYWRKTKARLFRTMRQTGLRIFARHMFEPLYGDRTRSGIAVGIFLRFFILLFLLFWTGMRLLLVASLLVGYVLLLPGLLALFFWSLMS